jgi:DNA repair exonuclease SbcCD nuclease subunit
MLDCKTNDDAIKRLHNSLQYEIRGISQGPKILVGHFMLQGTMLGNTVLEGHGGEVVLPQSMFDGLDGVIMGHIHPHQIVRKNPLITYVGSMERKDFGDAKSPKYFLSINIDKDDIVFSFEKLSIRPVYDIDIDQSSVKDGSKVTEGCIEFLQNYATDNKMLGAIVRINIFINEKALYELDKDQIGLFMKEKLNIHNCVNIHTQVVTKRQLRKSTITERIDPLKSFVEYLDLVEDPQMKEKMKQIGSKIIRDRRTT